MFFKKIVRAVFPLVNKQMIDLEALNELIHSVALSYPHPDAKLVTNNTRLEYQPLSVISRKKTMENNSKIFTNHLNESFGYIKNLNPTEELELRQKSNNIMYNLYFYDDLNFVFGLNENLLNKLKDLEMNFDLNEYLKSCFLEIKKHVLNESIRDFGEYLNYVNINNKKGHRDELFHDLRSFLYNKDPHIQNIDTKALFDYKNSKRVKIEIENYLKLALKDVQEPHDVVVI